MLNVWLPCPCHVVAPAILQSLIVPLCSPRGFCVVLAVSECNTAKCSFSAVCPPWEAFDQLRCCVCFRVSLLACSAPWLSCVLNWAVSLASWLSCVPAEFSRIRRRVHYCPDLQNFWKSSVRSSTDPPMCNLVFLFCLMRQKNYWRCFAFSQMRLVEGKIVPAVLLPHEAK